MCYRPINLKGSDGRYVKVKCGKCLECLNEKRNAWVIRMNEELKTAHGKGVFFTLTYSDENIPKNFLVYETSFSDTPRLYESESDYNYATPVGFRGKKSVTEPVDKVLRQFYKDYRIEDFNIDNNYKKFKEYEELKSISRDLLHQCGEVVADPFEGSNDDYLDYGDTPYDLDSSYCNYDPDDSVIQSSTYSPEEIEDLMDYDLDKVLKQFDYEYYDKCRRERYDGEEEALDQERWIEEDLQQNDQAGIDRGTPMVADRSTEDRDTPRDKEDGRIKPYLVLSFNSVRQKDLQDWLKRGREKLRRNDKTFTYFITSEYGPRTLRPHYHGCFFGVTLDDVRFMFDDWRARFGRRISADNIKGTAGCSYCAKYCAKGFYEHPLCSRDFFYTKEYIQTGSDALDKLMNRLEFSEYHSKHYERCLEFFHIDKPIVTPTFKLVSKGLGIDYIARTKDYFALDEAEEKISILKHSDDYDQVFTETMEEIQRFFRYTSQEGYSFNMPQYYSAKMFSDNLRHAFANYVRSQYDKLYYEQFRALQAADPTREDAEIISQLEEEQRRTKIHSLEKKLSSIEKYYNKSKL